MMSIILCLKLSYKICITDNIYSFHRLNYQLPHCLEFLHALVPKLGSHCFEYRDAKGIQDSLTLALI